MRYKGLQLPPKAREILLQIVKEGYIRPTLEEELYVIIIREFLEEKQKDTSLLWGLRKITLENWKKQLEEGK